MCAYLFRADASSPARSSADTHTPGEANGSAATTAFSPLRVSSVNAPPRSAARGRPTMCTSSPAASNARASNRYGSSWLPAITTVRAPVRPTRTRNSLTSRSDSPVGLRLSKTSPEWRTRSIDSRSMKPARLSRIVSISSSRWRPFQRRPTCQSLVCTILTRAILRAQERVFVPGGVLHFALPRCPGGEREVQQYRRRQLRLGDDHRAR